MSEEVKDPVVDELEEKVNSLITDFSGQRKSLENQVLELEKLRAKVDILFPESLDNRNVMRFHERVKSTTELYKSILDVRKEIIKSIKDEIDLRRKIDNKSGNDDFSDYDIRSLAHKVEKITRSNEQTNDFKLVKKEEGIGNG